MASLSRAVFLDRDGTLIEDVGYPRDPERVQLLEGAVDGLRRLRAAGLQLVVIGNQSGVGRGLVTELEARAVHERFVAQLEHHGVRLDAAKYCPHAPWDGCACRKPQTQLLLEAAAELGVDLGSSYMVGDKASDVETGSRAGCRTILLRRDGERPTGADHVARDWAETVRIILDEIGAK